jgi:hypothetical protein
MKHFIISLSFFVFCIIAHKSYGSQNSIDESIEEISQDKNYIYTRTMLDEQGTTYLDNVQYFDGLGRPVQTVQRGITPQKSDVISLMEYDGFGRESKVWLPVHISGNNGGYASPATIQAQAINAVYLDNSPYSEPVYEPSPLNRVQQQFGPGAEWRSGGGHSVKTDYLTNNAAGLSCNLYEIENDSILRYKGKYANAQLYVTQITDEDGNISYEFKDKLGKVVLTRQINNTGFHDTYYVYDDFGNLVYVLPPLAADATRSTTTSYKPNTEIIRNYAYVYQYDHRNRCIKKKLPGADWIFYVYDKADRLILTQDGEQRKSNKNEWTFNKYDALGRVILSGIYTVSTPLNILCEQFNAIVVKEEVGNGNYGYTWNTPPVVTSDKVLFVNYYDDYNLLLSQEAYFSNNLSYDNRAGYDKHYTNEDTPSCSAKGLLTGTRKTIGWFGRDCNGHVL